MIDAWQMSGAPVVQTQIVKECLDIVSPVRVQTLADAAQEALAAYGATYAEAICALEFLRRAAIKNVLENKMQGLK